jgi:hypothetical protein
MPKPCGLPKTGGRSKGTPNKKSLSLEYLEENFEFNPLKDLVSILPSLAPDQRASILLRMLDFIYPKKKAIEVTPVEVGDQDESLRPSIIRIVAAPNCLDEKKSSK